MKKLSLIIALSLILMILLGSIAGAQSSPTPVGGVSLSRTTMQLTVGSSDSLRATVTPSDATNRNVTWSSSNTAVATVTSTSATDARVTAVGPGTAIITATTVDGARTATCTVTVSSTSPTPPTGGGIISVLLVMAGFSGLATAAIIRQRKR